MNPGGSVKDRIARRMIEEAELSGRLRPDDTLIEPTSGNTGIGIAMVAAVKGYKAIITMPEKMSQEKICCLAALGAQVIRTPTEEPFDSPKSHLGIARDLKEQMGSRATILDQYGNPNNALAHYCETAEEIWRDCGGRVDAVVMGAGTGGTASGVGKRLKELNPKVRIVGVDPQGSVLARPESLNGPLASYDVEGLGYDFAPKALDYQFVDEWIKTDDRQAFEMARRLVREEGLLVGGSSGSAMWAAVKIIAKRFEKGARIVVILPDSIRNYMSKFADDSWMIIHDYIEEFVPIKGADSSDALLAVEALPMGLPCRDALKKIKLEWTPVVDHDNLICCVVHKAAVLKRIMLGSPLDSVERVGKKEFKCVTRERINHKPVLSAVCTGYPVYVDDGDHHYYYIDPSLIIAE